MAGDYTIWSYNHDLWRLGIMIMCLAFATVTFESALSFVKWWAQDRGHAAVRDALHKATDELTVLGFFSFLLLLTLQLQGTNTWVKNNYMTFELAHVWIFVLGLLHASVAIIWSVVFALWKAHYRALASVTADDAGAMISDGFGIMRNDEERDAAMFNLLRTPRYMVHLLDPLRLIAMPRFEQAQEFLFFSRYFRYHHRESIAHAFGAHGDEHAAHHGDADHGDGHSADHGEIVGGHGRATSADQTGWSGGRSSVLHKVKGKAAIAAAFAGNATQQKQTTQLNVAELLAISVNHR